MPRRGSAQRPRRPVFTRGLTVAVIVVLVVLVVCLAARLLRAKQLARAVTERYGLAPGGPSTVPRKAPLRDLTDPQLLRPRSFEEYRAEFDALAEQAIRLGDFRAPTLTSAAETASSALAQACGQALRGGKRLRPVILMEIARCVSQKRAAEQMPAVDPANVALAVECCHAASLVVDDMPAFDNDETRRDQPSVWKATTPATALMAATAIVAGAFQNICRQVDWLRENCAGWIDADRVGTLLCSQISQSLGVMGAAGGQHMDMEELPPAAQPTPQALRLLVQRKTSPFFEMAFVAGYLVGGGQEEEVENLRRAGRFFGTAYQIADDIGDMQQDRARHEAGKPGWNYANAMGEEEARNEVKRNLESCKTILANNKLFTPVWGEIYAKLWKMAGTSPEAPAGPESPSG